METKAIIWLIIFSAIIPLWFYLETNEGVDYEYHKQLVDPVTGVKRRPIDVIELDKVINYTHRYIESTNAEERLFDLLYQLNLENPFIQDPDYTDKRDLIVSGWPVSDQASCGHQLSWILNQLNLHKNYTLLRGTLGLELTRFMDSFGRPEAGTYSGTTKWLGSYERCRRATLDGGQIKSRYCIARMVPKWWPRQELEAMKTWIRVGVCLPETCDTQSYDHHKDAIEQLAKHQLDDFHRNGLEFNSLYCLPDERSPLRQIPASGHIYLVVVCSWLAIVITANLIYEYSAEGMAKLFFIGERRQRYLSETKYIDHQVVEILQASKANDDLREDSLTADLMKLLSIRNAIKRFKSNTFNVKYKQGHRVRVDLGCLNFFKFALCILVILGHSSYLENIHARTLTNRIEMCLGELGRMALSIVRSVDTFFLFFGLLVTYTLMKKFTTNQLSNPLTWIVINLGILLRIAPIFMLVYWYSRSISPYTSSGPWWDYGVDSKTVKGSCMRDPWWKSIPYFGSMGSPSVPGCNLPSWFIIRYLQISIILPLLTYLIRALPSNIHRFTLVMAILCASASNISFRLSTQDSADGKAFTLYGAFISDLAEKFQATGYLSSFGRFGAVAVGCLTGYLLRMYELGHIKRWPRWLESRLAMLAIVMIHMLIVFAPLIGSRLLEKTDQIATLEQVILFNAITMIMWPILNACLVLHGCTVAAHTVILRFLSHSTWHVLSKLGLCMYLIHWEVIYVSVLSFETAPTYGFVTDVIKMWGYATLVTATIAFLVHLLVEIPIAELLVLIARRLSPQSQQKESQEQANDEKDIK